MTRTQQATIQKLRRRIRSLEEQNKNFNDRISHLFWTAAILPAVYLFAWVAVTHK